MWASKVLHSPPSSLDKYSRSLFSTFPRIKCDVTNNGKLFSMKLQKIISFKQNPKKFQWNAYPKFKKDNKINSRFNFAVLGSSVVNIFSGCSQTFNGKYRNVFLSAVFVSAFNFDEDSASEENIKSSISDLEFVHHLTDNTLRCKSCHLRIRFDHKVAKIEYCKCPDGKALQTEVGGWKPFMERPSAVVWRKEHESLKGLYAYKMYGRLDDVSAIDFLRVQLDIDFRKRWDTSASQLMVVEENCQSNSDIIYWEMQWPKPFSKRDYVFQRQLTYHSNENVCVVSSVATSHPSIPPKRSSHRVKEYWSYMAIRPIDDFKKPGLEFVLTYFDNPGLSIPATVSSWVAMTALPTFVSNLHNATSKVSELVGPEPTLLRSLLQQLDVREVEQEAEINSSIDQEESIVLQLDCSLPNEEVVETGTNPPEEMETKLTTERNDPIGGPAEMKTSGFAVKDEKVTDICVEQPVEQPSEIAIEQPIEIVEQPSELAVAQPIDCSTVIEIVVEQPSEIAVTQPIEIVVEQPSEIAVEQPIAIAVEQPVEKAPLKGAMSSKVENKSSYSESDDVSVANGSDLGAHCPSSRSDENATD